MANRNYKKEAAWKKSKYARLVADIDPTTAANFKKQLEKDGRSYKEWLVEQIEKYLK